ncbi:DUF6281 family protein [Streptomyces sp. NPDC017991]|uniref:DUF6281 family protein n=1 Tax=Streptomyces sp. NPDC017991 TaxID=3365026 RepID=UPI0037B50DE2
MMILAVACTSESSSDGGEEAASCAYRVLYQDRTYRDVANVEFAAGEKLGSATIPPCEDTGGQDKEEESGEATTAYAVDGISPKVAVAVGDSPDDTTLVAAYSGNKLPPEIQELIDGS